MDRIASVQAWMETQERTTGYIAKKSGYSAQWISTVMNGHRPFSDKLAGVLHEKLGIEFDNPLGTKRGQQKGKQRTAKTATPPALAAQKSKKKAKDQVTKGVKTGKPKKGQGGGLRAEIYPSDGEGSKGAGTRKIKKPARRKS